jgi:hypothetical protein
MGTTASKPKPAKKMAKKAAKAAARRKPAARKR